MKKLLLLSILLILSSCSKESNTMDCNCYEDVQYYTITSTGTTVGDFITYDIENPDCTLDGQMNITETPFNNAIIREVSTIRCEN